MLRPTTVIMDNDGRRALFLEAYIASNCTIEFDPNFAVDDTVGTYVTNYVIGGVGILLGTLFVTFKLCRRTPRSEQDRELLDSQQRIEWTWQAVYFFLSATGYTTCWDTAPNFSLDGRRCGCSPLHGPHFGHVVGGVAAIVNNRTVESKI